MGALHKARILLPTLTPRKLWNWSRIWASFQVSRLLRRPIHWGNPVKVGVEPTTSCNLRCPECPSGLRSFTRPTGMLSMETFASLTEQVRRDVAYMLFYFQGEPFLNPAFLKMVRHAADRRIFTATSTNGHYLKPEICREVVQSGLHEVTISVDGATQQTYQQYRVGGDLEKVKQGIRNLVQARKELKSRTPHLILQFIVFQSNEHEIDAVRQMGKELGVDEVAVKTAQIYDYENGHALIPRNEKYSRYALRPDGRYALKNKLKNQCWKMWMGAEITWDARVLPCCFDKDAQYEMGSAAVQPFHSIWKGERYRVFRQSLLQNRRGIEMCTNCTEGTRVFE